ncbi:MAG: fatty acid--CoA ligase family protein [Azonexus sp.]|jgi:O-succinylbenzoic acid--CoA ligase|uniref:class I adenylate-forming enzyme family protein n=1 Tax=Azonexus sp. TaxID=1872668 RepID=UPI00282F5EED|nr:fatty acid--CoA ligase family protein [Azonexus sp.]MDR0777063.1 fatty acid--CoA ligase family protein [Azonexus sp.]
MADHRSLAYHLQQAAGRRPATPVLHAGDQQWTYAKWLDDCRLVADSLEDNWQPLTRGGDSLALARLTWACSLAGRPFWPLAPERRAMRNFPELPGIALIISTSGSEGRPRAVPLGTVQLNAAAAAANARLGLTTGDLWLNCLPLFHIGGQSILWRCARADAAMLLHDGFKAEAVGDDLQRHRVTHISLVPAMLAALLDHEVAPPASLRVALIGGAALSRPLYERATVAGWKLWPSYGMSESSALVAAHDPADGPWHEGLVGRPLAGTGVSIGDDGRIRLRGQQLMAGYLDGGGIEPDGWLRSGDLGRLDEAGRLTVLGRADDMLISGGRNIHPQEIESCLAACPGVCEIAVSARPDPVWGDLIVALVVGPTELDALQAHARQHLPSAALPRRLVRLDRLPRNAAGKLDRQILRDLAARAGA